MHVHLLHPIGTHAHGHMHCTHTHALYIHSYVALETLAQVVAVDTLAVQRHRNTIVECVKDADVSIRKRALDLVYALVNENNIKTLTNELLEYLEVGGVLLVVVVGCVSESVHRHLSCITHSRVHPHPHTRTTTPLSPTTPTDL